MEQNIKFLSNINKPISIIDVIEIGFPQIYKLYLVFLLI